MTRPVRTLLFSTLFPSQARPTHGLFVEARQKAILEAGGVQTVVVAPVPWFPSTHARFGDYATYAATPDIECRHAMVVHHPRYPLLPKIGMSTAPLSMALACMPTLARLRRAGFDFDLIDAHYFYPDGVAAALLSRWFDRPLVITARGSDLNVIANHAWPRRLMRWAARQAGACIAVSGALSERLTSIGAPGERVHVIRNGVDAERFRPESREAALQRLGYGNPALPLLVSVGNLLEVKRHHLVVGAVARLRDEGLDLRLAVVGRGPLDASLRQQAAELGIADRVRIVGAVDQDELRWWYSAADLLVLASSREGLPNVLLEAMACGTPVLASEVGGVPEIVTDDRCGACARFDTAEGLATQIRRQLQFKRCRTEIRDHAVRLGWPAAARTVRGVFERVLEGANR